MSSFVDRVSMRAIGSLRESVDRVSSFVDESEHDAKHVGVMHDRDRVLVD